jgi:hypothetical protein
MNTETQPDLPLVVDTAPEPTIEVEIEGLKPEAAPPAPAPTPEPAPAPAADDGSVEVDLAPAEPESAPEPQDKGPDPVTALQAQLERMRERAKAERDGRLEAERTVQAREAALARETRGRAEAQMHAIVNAIAAEKGEAEAIKTEMRAAQAAGDVDRIAEAQMRLGEIGSRLASLNEGRANLDAYLKNPQRQAPPSAPPQRRAEPQRPAPAADDLDDTPADPIDAYIGRQTPRVQQYLRTRDARSWLSNTQSAAKLASAHHAAIAEGYVEETPGYFAFIDDKMGVAKMEPPKKAPTPKPVKAPVAAAPISAKASSAPAPSNGTNPRTVTLTAKQVQAAKDLGLSNAEYAKRVWQMKQPDWNGPKFGGN